MRRSIPALIIIFLLVVAAARTLSLLAQYDEVERNAQAILNLAAGEVVNALALPDDESKAPLAEILQKHAASAPQWAHAMC